MRFSPETPWVFAVEQPDSRTSRHPDSLRIVPFEEPEMLRVMRAYLFG